jgi:hypothetical protein
MLWVARDEDGEANLFVGKPEWFKSDTIKGHFGSGCRPSDEQLASLPREMYPDLALGECRELRMVDESASTQTETCE